MAGEGGVKQGPRICWHIISWVSVRITCFTWCQFYQQCIRFDTFFFVSVWEYISFLHDYLYGGQYILSHSTNKKVIACVINLSVYPKNWCHNQHVLLSDGTLLYERVPNKPEAEKAAMNNISPSLLKRRAYEEVNGMDGKDLN